MPNRLLLSLLALLVLSAPTRHRAITPPPAPVPQLDARRSFIVTDQVLLENFTFRRVLDQLVARSGVPGMTSAQLYRQWFDTQNPKPGMADAAAPHCDDFTTNGKPSFNGFTRRCPTSEGLLAQSPFADGEYFPIAVVNRFDLTPADGSNCGQYRVVFARKTPVGSRLHIIFEATLPNRTPAAGLSGCRSIAQFWSELSPIDSVTERRARLESFFFDGVNGFAPAIDPGNLAPGSGGGIRTTQDSPGSVRMYQFRLTKECSGTCTLRMTPDVLENIPHASLFDSTLNTALAREFQDVFVEQVPNLAVKDPNEYFMVIPRQFLIAESDPGDTQEAALPYAPPFLRGAATKPEFRTRILNKLQAIGSTLTPDQIIYRAETQTCVGCHAIGGDVGEGVNFPRSIDFEQQITEDRPQTGPDGLRYYISDAIRDVFVPHRMQILKDFLVTGKAPVRSQTVGGNRTVD